MDTIDRNSSEEHTSSDRPHPRRSRSRRRTRHDPTWLADTLEAGARGGPAAQVKAAFRIVDETLRAVERTAWDIRGVADRAVSAWADAQDTREAWTEQSRDVRDAVSNVPVKVRRVAWTAWMLAQLTTTYRVHAVRSAFLSEEAAADSLGRLHEKNARRFYETSVEQGGAFLKVGQLLSSRRDLLPDAWIRELSRLQDEVPPMPFDDVVAVVEEDFGAPLRDVFETFEEEPVAAASIGQVHRATTKTGDTLAVKVQRPKIAETIEVDLELLELFMESIRSMLPPMDFDTIQAEIRSTLRKETDYVREAETMDRVATFFSDHPHITTPHPIASHCREHVMSSHFIEGRKITDVLTELKEARDAGDERAGRRLDRILTLLLEAYVRQVLEAGIFQADPHPGNLLVTDDDRLVVLDFGAAQPMPDEIRRVYLEITRAFVFDDRDGLVRLLDKAGFRTRSGKPDTLLMFADALLAQLRDAAHGKADFSWPTKEQLMNQTAGLLRQSEADPVETLPPEFVMIGRVFGTLGGLFLHYQPNIDAGRALVPILQQVVFSPQS